MKTFLWPVMLVLSMLFPSCVKEAPKEPRGLTALERGARFPNDLGAGTIDVSAYPENVRKDYALFMAVCSQCHTPARPINAPIFGKSDWKRYVHRMHVKMRNKGFTLSDEDEKRIVAFLAYDSETRKKLPAFKAEQETLKAVYEEISKERERLILEETKHMPTKESVYVGVK